MTGCSSAPSFPNLLSSSSPSRKAPSFLCTSSETQTGVFRFIGCAAGDLACRNLSPLVCVRRNLLCSLPSSFTHSSQIELEPLIEAPSYLTDEDELRTVSIKIQLRKECKFGEQFFIVGAQPDLGVWNPLDAIPMTWSDDHLWTAELDIPIGESVQFKFILREISGKFLWQPGKDRVLHTWETRNIISVIEDWEDVEAQQVNEERVVNKTDLMETKIKQLKHSDEMYNDEETCESLKIAEDNISDYSNTDLEISNELCGNQVLDENATSTSQPTKNEDAISEPVLVEEDRIKEEEQVKVELGSSKIVNDIESETTIEDQVNGYTKLQKVNGRSSIFSAEHLALKVENDEEATLSEGTFIRESDPWHNEIKWGQTMFKRFLNNFGLL